MVYKEIKTNEEYVDAVKSGSALVYFKAAWCGPCHITGPIFEDLAKKYSSKNLKFVKVDIDSMEDVAWYENITTVPTFIHYRNGVVEEKLERRISKEKIESMCKI